MTSVHHGGPQTWKLTTAKLEAVNLEATNLEPAYLEAAGLAKGRVGQMICLGTSEAMYA